LRFRTAATRAFSAPDATLVPNDTNGIWDVFVP
jgi:hypothetical protein